MTRVLVLLGMVGCAGGGDRCEQQADCEGLDEGAVATCQDVVEAAIASADERGCAAEQRSVQGCLDANGECDESGDSPVFRVAVEACEDEQEAFVQCLNG